MIQKIKPFLKWAGNKYRCLSHLLSHFDKADRLIEPFTGSGSIFLNTHFPKYLLAEENEDLVHLFTFVQKEGLDFIDYCYQFFSHQNNTVNMYYQFRSEFNETTDLYRRAGLFLYLNRHGYNGLCRYNQSKKYNVPFGRYLKPYFPRTELLYFHQKSQLASFIKQDFRKTFLDASPGDFIYCDPPYVPLSSTAHFNAYINKKFVEDDQIALAQLAKKSAEKGITVLISNHDTDATRQFYKHATLISFPVTRQISCLPHRRKPIQELLAIYTAK